MYDIDNLSIIRRDQLSSLSSHRVRMDGLHPDRVFAETLEGFVHLPVYRPESPSEKMSACETLSFFHKKKRVAQEQELLELKVRNLHPPRPALPQHEICDSASVEFLGQGESFPLERGMNAADATLLLQGGRILEPALFR